MPSQTICKFIYVYTERLLMCACRPAVYGKYGIW